MILTRCFIASVPVLKVTYYCLHVTIFKNFLQQQEFILFPTTIFCYRIGLKKNIQKLKILTLDPHPEK